MVEVEMVQVVRWWNRWGQVAQVEVEVEVEVEVVVVEWPVLSWVVSQDVQAPSSLCQLAETATVVVVVEKAEVEQVVVEQVKEQVEQGGWVEVKQVEVEQQWGWV